MVPVLVLFSGLIAVDRLAAVQLAISRPFVIGVALGLISGNLYECMLAGAVFEFLGLTDVQVGAHIPRDDSFAAYVACLLLINNDMVSLEEYTVSFFIITLLVRLVSYVDLFIRRINMYLYLRADSGAIKLDVFWILLFGVLLAFLKGVIFYNLGYIFANFLLDIIFVHLGSTDNMIKYFLLSILFMSGFLLVFLSSRKLMKYAFFCVGALFGLVLV